MISVAISSNFPPSVKVSIQYMQTVCSWGGGGVLSRVGDHILPEFHTVCEQIFHTVYEQIQNLSQDKNLEGEGASNR